jgi:hypothetical protein
MTAGCETCLALLNEALNLCVRARTLDGIDRRAATLAVSSDPDEWQSSGRFDVYVERHNIMRPDSPIETRCLTSQLWASDQYETDLADWERRARRHLTYGCAA